MSQQHAQFEEASRGEPSYQIGYAPGDNLPPLSDDQADVPGQKLQARSLGAAKSTTLMLRFVLALLSLIFVFVLVVLVITSSVSFINFSFVLLFAVLAIFLDLIFAYGEMLLPGKPPSQRSERACEADFLSLCSSLRNPWIRGLASSLIEKDVEHATAFRSQSSTSECPAGQLSHLDRD